MTSGRGPYTEFRRLLRLAIGNNRSQAEFARSAGLSAEHVNRMLNAETISLPSMNTLNKIAGSAENGVTISALRVSCGYASDSSSVESKTLEHRKTLPVADRAEKCIDDIRAGVDEFVSKHASFATLWDFLDTAIMLYSVERISVQITETKELDSLSGRAHQFASHAASVVMSFSDDTVDVQFGFAVYYAESVTKNVFLTDVAYDLSSLEEIDPFSDFVRLAEYNAYSKDPVLVIRSKKVPRRSETDASRKFAEKVHEISVSFGISEKEAVFRAMFGNPDAPQRISTVEGTGFYIDNAPESAFRKFLQNHKKTFCVTENEKTIYDEVMDGSKPLEEIFSGYSPDDRACACNGWTTAICNVILRESGIRVHVWLSNDSAENSGSRSCVVFPDSAPWLMNDMEKSLTQDTAYRLLDRYAIDFRSEVEDVWFALLLPL